MIIVRWFRKIYLILQNKKLWTESLRICTETCIYLLGIWRRELPCKNLMMTEFLKLVKTREAEWMETEWWETKLGVDKSKVMSSGKNTCIQK